MGSSPVMGYLRRWLCSLMVKHFKEDIGSIPITLTTTNDAGIENWHLTSLIS